MLKKPIVLSPLFTAFFMSNALVGLPRAQRRRDQLLRSSHCSQLRLNPDLSCEDLMLASRQIISLKEKSKHVSLKRYLISFFIVTDPTLTSSPDKSGFTTRTGQQSITWPPRTPCTHAHSSVPSSAHVHIVAPWEEAAAPEHTKRTCKLHGLRQPRQQRVTW